MRTLLAAAALALAAAPVAAQSRDAPIPHDTGQSINPVFEGWYPNDDGTFTLSFGYFNRNYETALDIPVGPHNRFEPGPADRGQPTHLLPRRQTGIFTVVVPADFSNQTLSWSLTAGGETHAVPGHIRPEWQIDAMHEVTSGNHPPVVTFTGLRWRDLMGPTPDDPPGFEPPSAAECYRFCLAHPAVSVALAAPGNRAELEQDLALLDDWHPPDPSAYEALRHHVDRVKKHAREFW